MVTTTLHNIPAPHLPRQEKSQGLGISLAQTISKIPNETKKVVSENPQASSLSQTGYMFFERGVRVSDLRKWTVSCFLAAFCALLNGRCGVGLRFNERKHNCCPVLQHLIVENEVNAHFCSRCCPLLRAFIRRLKR